VLARNLFSIMWMAWALYWLVLSRNVKATTREEPRASRLAHVLPLLLAGFLLAAPRMPIAALDTRFLVYGPWQYWRRRVVRSRPAVQRLGAPSHRQELERYRHAEAGSRAHHQRPLRNRPPSDLHRAVAGVRGHRRCAR